MIAEAINNITNFFLKPIVTIFEFLTSPKTLISLTKRLTDAIGAMDEAFFAYQIPMVFYWLGLFFFLGSVAFTVFSYLTDRRGIKVFLPVLWAGLFFPLFAYKGVPCTDETAGTYPCVPQVEYKKELVSYGDLFSYKQVKFMVKGDNLEVKVEDVLPKQTNNSFNFSIFVLNWEKIRLEHPEHYPPLGTKILFDVSEQSMIWSRQIFYSGLAQYEDSLSEFKDVYLKIMRTYFNLAVSAAFVTAIGEGILTAFFGKVGKGAKGGMKNYLVNNFPILRFVLDTALYSGVLGAREVAQRTAQVNLTLAGIVASLPLLLTLSFVAITYIIFLALKLAIIAAPLLIAFSIFNPGIISRAFGYFVALLLFPILLGAVFNLSTRILFAGGINKLASELKDQAQVMADAFYVKHPTAALVAAQAADLVVKQTKNLVACARAPVEPNWDPNTPGRELGDSRVACYPSYAVAHYLSESYRSQIPNDPEKIRGDALAIAKAFSLDVLTRFGTTGLEREYAIPKGQGEGESIGAPQAKMNIYYGTSFDKIYFHLIVYHKVKQEVIYGYDPMFMPPIEVGGIAKGALAIYTNPKPTKENLAELLDNIDKFLRDMEEIARLEGTLVEGHGIPQFLRKTIPWEIAWTYSPEYILEKLKKSQSGTPQLRFETIKDAITTVPPIVNEETLGKFSPLYRYKKGQEQIEIVYGTTKIPTLRGEQRVASHFLPGFLLRGAPVSLSSSNVICEEVHCRISYHFYPYLPYLYLDHHEVLNGLSQKALTSLKDTNAQNALAIFWIVLVIVLALYVFRALTEILATLFEVFRPGPRLVLDEVVQGMSSLGALAGVFVPPVDKAKWSRRVESPRPNFWRDVFADLFSQETRVSRTIREELSGFGLKALFEGIEVDRQRDIHQKVHREMVQEAPLLNVLAEMGHNVLLSYREVQRVLRGERPEVAMVELPYFPLENLVNTLMDYGKNALKNLLEGLGVTGKIEEGSWKNHLLSYAVLSKEDLKRVTAEWREKLPKDSFYVVGEAKDGEDGSTYLVLKDPHGNPIALFVGEEEKGKSLARRAFDSVVRHLTLKGHTGETYLKKLVEDLKERGATVETFEDSKEMGRVLVVEMEGKTTCLILLEPGLGARNALLTSLGIWKEGRLPKETVDVAARFGQAVVPSAGGISPQTVYLRRFAEREGFSLGPLKEEVLPAGVSYENLGEFLAGNKQALGRLFAEYRYGYREQDVPLLLDPSYSAYQNALSSVAKLSYHRDESLARTNQETRMALESALKEKISEVKEVLEAMEKAVARGGASSRFLEEKERFVALKDYYSSLLEIFEMEDQFYEEAKIYEKMPLQDLLRAALGKDGGPDQEEAK